MTSPALPPEDFRQACVEIQSVAREIRCRCDGGRTKDGIGFRPNHASFGRVLAHAPIEMWSPGVASRGISVLLVYPRQIGDRIVRLKELQALLPENPAPEENKVVVGIERGRLAIIAPNCEASAADKLRTEKVARMLGMTYDKEERAWYLQPGEIDEWSFDEHLVELELARWCILPTATGYLGSHLQKIKDKRRASALAYEASRNADRARAEAYALSVGGRPPVGRQESLDGKIKNGRWEADGRECPALWFLTRAQWPHLSELKARFGERLRSASSDARAWVIPNPTPGELASAKAFGAAKQMDMRTL